MVELAFLGSNSLNLGEGNSPMLTSRPPTSGIASEAFRFFGATRHGEYNLLQAAAMRAMEPYT